MKLTDALAKFLIRNNINHVFGLQGGAVVHIFDSLERFGVGVTYTNHEQSAALAAVAYAKVTENIGCAVVTTGPGATNAITGLLAAWQDSIPCLFISGQVRSQHTSYGRKVRQVGTQEVNICDIVKPITKYSKFIDSKDCFVAELEHAVKIACSGRPGPVWLDLPLEFQWDDVSFNENSVIKFQKPEHKIQDLEGAIASLELLNNAQRPLLVLGYGVRLAGRSKNLDFLIKQHKLPFVTTWTGADLFPTEDPLNLGIIGMSGQRGANKAIFNADLLICLGTHLSIPHTTTLYDTYAPQAKKVIVNIDADQLDNLNVKFDIKINEDVNEYIDWLIRENVKSFSWPNLIDFKNHNWYVPKATNRPNSNLYLRTLTEQVTGTCCLIVDGGGTALYTGFQSSVFKLNDRIICSSAISSMGTGLAETIGVSKYPAFSRLLCIIGDGSFLMNVQDLQTIRQDNINVVISVINNNGYLAIRHTQKEFLDGRYFGCHPDWNLTMPSFEKIAAAFDIPYIKLDSAEDCDFVVKKLLATSGPIICEVVVEEEQEVLFKQKYVSNNGIHNPQDLSNMTGNSNH
jgi:acetolactate synthase-1/2/3 large subunit